MRSEVQFYTSNQRAALTSWTAWDNKSKRLPSPHETGRTLLGSSGSFTLTMCARLRIASSSALPSAKPLTSSPRDSLCVVDVAVPAGQRGATF
jgi:hypothetical protein